MALLSHTNRSVSQHTLHYTRGSLGVNLDCGQQKFKTQKSKLKTKT